LYKKFQVAIYITHKHLQPSQNFQVLTKINTAEYLKVATNIYNHQINCRCLLKLQVATSGTLKSKITGPVSIYCPPKICRCLQLPITAG